MSSVPVTVRTAAAWLLAGIASSPAADLTVDVGGVGAAHGDIRIALYADASAFDARTPLRASVLPAAVPLVSVTFEALAAGDYAVLAFHDVDGDGALGRGAFGVPSEPWTGSTSGTRFRAPSWNAYVVSVPEGAVTLSLEL